ncbi:hypothetical protein DFH09DRAFT_1041730, partial [Mycena vulgaris]
GLEKYQPDETREAGILPVGRFPRRNRFISDYIFEKTGKRRSAKQVGNRLQQLRESCGGKKLLRRLAESSTESSTDVASILPIADPATQAESGSPANSKNVHTIGIWSASLNTSTSSPPSHSLFA